MYVHEDFSLCAQVCTKQLSQGNTGIGVMSAGLKGPAESGHTVSFWMIEYETGLL